METSLQARTIKLHASHERNCCDPRHKRFGQLRLLKFPILGAARLWRDGRLARPGRPDARFSPFAHAPYPASLLQFDGFDRQIPVRLEDREAPLLLTLVGVFIGGGPGCGGTGVSPVQADQTPSSPRLRTRLTRLHFSSSTVLIGKSQCASRIVKRLCSSRS
jgi:hypothetical protein